MRSLVYCAACVFISAVFAFAGSPDYASLLKYLDARYAASIESIATVDDIHHQKLIFEKPRKKMVRGEELLVLKAVSGKPPALYDTKAVIKVTAVRGSTIVARVVHTMTGPPQSGDPVVRPASPRIFLSRDSADSQTAPAYQRLLQTLLSANYHVIETAGPESIERTGGYGLHVHVSESTDQTAVNIRSIYTPATLFSETYPLSDAPGADAGGAHTGMAAGSSPATASPSRPAIKPEAVPPKDRGTDKSKAQKIRLQEKFNRITTAELDGVPPEELILLSNKGVFAYRLVDERITRLDTYLFESKDRIGLHLYAMDLDGRGRETVLATCAQKTTYMDAEDSTIRSLALDWKEGHWIVRAADIPYYLRVLQTPESGPLLLGQKKQGPETYSGPIFRVQWDGRKETFSRDPAYPPATGIHCLYQFVFAGGSTEKILLLEPNNHVSLYQMPEERLLDMTDVQFGAYREADFPVRLAEKKYRGGFDDAITSQKAHAVRKLLPEPKLQSRCFFIQKRRTSEGFGGQMLELIRRETGRDRVIALEAKGQALHESWTSEGVPRDLVDFTFLRGDDKIQILALARDARGYILEFLSEAQ